MSEAEDQNPPQPGPERGPADTQAATKVLATTKEHHRRLNLEMERLVTLKAAAERDRDNAPKLGALCVLAIPAFFLWGFWIAFAVVVQVVLFIIGTWYITGVHIVEYAGNIVDCERDLRVVREQLAELGEPVASASKA